MDPRVVIAGDKRFGFTWQLVDRGDVLQSGKADTQAQAVNAGQAALMAIKDNSLWKPSKKATGEATPRRQALTSTDT